MDTGYIVMGVPLILVVGVVGFGTIHGLHSYFVTYRPQRARVRAEREARKRKELDVNPVARWLEQPGSEERP